MFPVPRKRKVNGHVTSHMTDGLVNSDGHVTGEPLENETQLKRKEVGEHNNETVKSTVNGRLNLNPRSELRLGLDPDHESCLGPDLGEEESDKGESTAEEGGDTLPYESTTTDTVPEFHEPVDFIECRVRPSSDFPASRDFHGTTSQQQQQHNKNPSVADDWLRRAKPMKRTNKAARDRFTAAKERQRAPHPPPRPVKLKAPYPRPSPAMRKRRPSGRMLRPPSNASEGDMAQADEMGEGRDDGFVDCMSSESLKRRCKKRSPGERQGRVGGERERERWGREWKWREGENGGGVRERWWREEREGMGEE